MKVGIVGLGVVGEAQAQMFLRYGRTPGIICEVVGVDPANPGAHPPSVLVDCDLILICVGTPSADDGSADLSQVEAAIADLPPKVPVALRSTVPPGTTDRLLGGIRSVDVTTFADFDPVYTEGDRLYVHAPEFMGENVLHSWQRPGDVPFMVIGGAPEATVFFRQMFARVFPGEIVTCSAREAELAKYLANLYWATRVTFVNEFANICETFGVDYENVRRAWLADPRITEPYTQVAGYPPGFGGRCWPKDLAALIEASDAAGYSPEFLSAVEEANARFQGFDS